MPAREHSLKADVLMFLVTLCAAGGWIFSKESLAEMPPLLFIASRFALAGLLLGLIGWGDLRRLSARSLRQAALVGLVFGFAMAFWIMGLSKAQHVGEGAFITALGVVLVPVLARLFFGDRPPRSTWVALPVALLGFACLSLQAGFAFEPGQWWFLAAAVMFSLVFITNSHVVQHVPVIALGAVQLSMVAVVVLPISVLFETWPTTVSNEVLGWVLASTLIGTTMRFFLQLSAQGLTTPSHAVVILMLEPVWTAILAALWLGESMRLIQFLGCGLIMASMVISRWSAIRAFIKRPTPPVPRP